jgi:hypothetical protein
MALWQAIRLTFLTGVIAFPVYIFVTAPHHPSDRERLDLVRQQYFERTSAACRELADLDDTLSGRAPTKPYETSLSWDMTWKPSRPELTELAVTLCGPTAGIM